MNLSLRKARKLETKIGNYHFNNDQFLLNVREVISSSDLDNSFKQAKNESLELFDKNSKLLSLRYALRSAISAANHTSGINDLMSEKAKVHALLNLHVNYIEGAFNLSKEDLIYMAKRDDLASSDNKSSNSFLSRADNTIKTFKIPGIEKDSRLYNDLSKKVLQLKSQIEDIDDKLMGLNSTVLIDISNDERDFLKELMIIV